MSNTSTNTQAISTAFIPGSVLSGGTTSNVLQYDQSHTVLIVSEANGLKSGKIMDGDTVVATFEDFGALSPVKVSPDMKSGSKGDDVLVEGETGLLNTGDGIVDKVNGNAGSDEIDAGTGDDLAAGDMVGEEWSFVDGKWVYDPSKIQIGDTLPSFDDTISGGEGNDVLLGNGGDDQLFGGAGDDTINAGTGDDRAFGGSGDDLLNLEDGDDYAEGGLGADIVNAGDGDDVVYGDEAGTNILSSPSGSGAKSVEQLAAESGWNFDDTSGDDVMSQSIATEAGTEYNLEFNLAANVGAGSYSGTVEIMWNGEVVDVVDTNSGALEKHEFQVTGTGGDDTLTFRVVNDTPEPTGPEINSDGPIAFYETTMTLNGSEETVAAFAPGQAKLYQVIDGKLNVFDTVAETYVSAGDPTGLKINAVGFNAEDDMIYGIAKKAGVDALGNPVEISDLMMMDAQGKAYRIGETGKADYVGDFDDSGNLWTFNSSMNRITRIDVDKLDADGNPEVTNFDVPNGLFGGRMYDIAFNSDENAFYAVEAPGKHGGEGKVHKIDLSTLETGGEPQITSIPITGTLLDGTMENGMVKGAYGAVFLDGDGNLYAGLNRGDHDLDGSTGSQGAIYKINVDGDAGTAYAEYMAEAPSTGSNDGAVDPRSIDAFAEVDQEASVLISPPVLTSISGGDDDLRGGDGNDLMYGGEGADTLSGGNDDDVLHGDAGADKIMGGAGNDQSYGGQGDDKIMDGAGNDLLDGGDGKDYINAGSGDDILSGGAGADKLVGGSGSDRIEGGAGDDHMWGGNWWKDGASDTFVVSAGSGKDMIHDFEAEQDVIDLSSYGLEFSDVQGLMTDKGWATEIDLSGLEGATSGDKLIIKSIDPDDLDESNFLL